MCGQYRYSLSNLREDKLTRYHCDNATKEEEPLVTTKKGSKTLFKDLRRRLVMKTGVTERVKLTGIALRASREMKHML